MRPPIWIDAEELLEKEGRGWGLSKHIRHNEYISALAGQEDETAQVLYTKLQNILLEESQTTRLRGMPQGKLHGGSLHKIRHGEFNVFTKKSRGLDPTQIAVAIVVDCSGSMRVGNRAVAAQKTARLLSETLHKCGASFGVYGYTSLDAGGQDYPCIFNVKDFNQPWRGQKDNLKVLAPYRNNYDAACILEVYKKLLAVNAKRRIMIVISDGQPAPEDTSYLRNLVPVLMNGVDVIGIGLAHTAVGDYYPTHVLCDVGDLAEKLAPVLRNVMLNKKAKVGGKDIAMIADPVAEAPAAGM